MHIIYAIWVVKFSIEGYKLVRVLAKTCALKLAPMKKKPEKYSHGFSHGKLTLKVRFLHFLTARHYVYSHNNSFELIFGQKPS